MKTWLKDHYYMYTDIMMYASIVLLILELMPNATMVYVSGGPTTAIPVSFPYYSLYLSSYGVVSYFLMFIATCILLRFDRRRLYFLSETDRFKRFII